MTHKLMVAVLFLGFVGTVLAANWSLAAFGMVPVGWGLMAPAGVFSAGFAFTARDLLHETGGRRYVLVAIVTGAALSWFLEDAQRFAVASGAAFLASEGIDLLVYTPLRARGWLRAVFASNVAGFTLDSVLFLWLAFGSLAFLNGQLVGKGYMTLGAVAILWAWRNRGLLSRYR